MIRTTGWLLLLPQLGVILVYLLFVVKMQLPVHNLPDNLNWTLLLVAPALLVAGYVFNNGLSLQEEHETLL